VGVVERRALEVGTFPTPSSWRFTRPIPASGDTARGHQPAIVERGPDHCVPLIHPDWGESRSEHAQRSYLGGVLMHMQLDHDQLHRLLASLSRAIFRSFKLEGHDFPAFECAAICLPRLAPSVPQAPSGTVSRPARPQRQPGPPPLGPTTACPACARFLRSEITRRMVGTSYGAATG